jgi:hypothetical protein
MKTENPQHVGKHAFEVAGLGRAPFRFVGLSENVIDAGGEQKAGGCCAYCFTGIRFECHILSSDGKRTTVGSNCIEKVGDAGLLKAYKKSPEFRAHQRDLRRRKSAVVFTELKALIESRKSEFASQPHPRGFVDRETGKPLTYLDSVVWLFENSGASGRASLLRALKRATI